MSVQRIRWPRFSWPRWGPCCLALLCAGCPERSATWIAPGSTAQRLVFVLGNERGEVQSRPVAAIRVQRCDAPAADPSATMWSTYAHVRKGALGSGASIAHIVYGQAPSTHEIDVPARPLASGRFVAHLGAPVAFTVDAAGRVTSVGRAC